MTTSQTPEPQTRPEREVTFERIRDLQKPILVDTPFAELIEAGRLTYRQLDHWTKRGWLRAEEVSPGSGNRRNWSREERAVALLMLRLTSAGFQHEAACKAAREVIERLKSERLDKVTVRVGHGIAITIAIARAVNGSSPVTSPSAASSSPPNAVNDKENPHG